MAVLEFYFDYGSPYSYIANTQLAALQARTGCEIAYRPMLLGGVFKATGNQSPALEPVAPKRTYGGIDMRRWIDHYGIPFTFNAHFPINTLKLMRVAHAAQLHGGFDALHAAVYPAFWVEGRDLGDVDIIAAVLAGAGLDDRALIDASRDDAVKARLRDTTDEAVDRGVFGAPTFFVGEALYFGNDRLGFVEEALLDAG